ncbi:MAG: YlbF family regulator [Clostridia bacterium]|nr:YlbF family regulator [Clostridia bacterium]
MEIINKARELGKLIQEDERYIEFAKAKEACDTDPEVVESLKKAEELRMEYQKEATASEPNHEKLEEMNEQFKSMYEKLGENAKMKDFEEKGKLLNDMMEEVMQILYMSVNGEDPMTCQPHAACDDENCSTCSGC